jgi:hypothetical protein
MFEWKRLLSGMFGDTPKACCGVKFEKPQAAPAEAVAVRTCCSGSSGDASSHLRAQPGPEIRAAASAQQLSG